MTPPVPSDETIRLDKWLWAARFFKTRQLAVEAINGGKVHLDGHRAKPGKTVRPGSRVTVHKGSLSWDLTVVAISRQRRGAADAALLYDEDEASRSRRQELVRERREQGSAGAPVGRPSKRDRRQIERFKQAHEA
ncbi:S4 domain-containing protein [Thioalkalicoccus limnaeus]|uniref:Heat shock protein 15 n=1 Tax=Thioalkalicoccus limnaeus TaxID=120681 RepID=A0ABV4BEQ9_9GAMM